MNESSANSTGAQAVAMQLLQKTGVLERAQIIADLNAEKLNE